MITLEQIRLLESKINKAVELINILKKENKTLKQTLESSQEKIKDFESLVNNFKDDQNDIEKCIINAIKTLDSLEDEIGKSDKSSKNTTKATDIIPNDAIPSTHEISSDDISAHDIQTDDIKSDKYNSSSQKDNSKKLKLKNFDSRDLSSNQDSSAPDSSDKELYTKEKKAGYILGLMNNNLYRVDILGASFNIKSQETSEYLDKLVNYLKLKINEFESKSSISDPLKIAITLCLNIVDELFKEKNKYKESKNSFSTSESLEIKRITDCIINKIDETIL